MNSNQSTNAVDKITTDMKTYERKFFDKIGFSIIIFSTFALFSAIAVHLILNLDLFPIATKLDAQTLGNFFIFIFGTSVTFAGAWVVIQIASKQEDLANTQLELATRQEELAKTQLELEKKSLHEYVASQMGSDAVIAGIQTLTQKIALFFGFYYKVIKSRETTQSNKYSENVEKEAELLLRTCLTQSHEVLKDITDLLQESWVSELTRYEKESQDAVNQTNGNKIYVLGNKLFFELKTLATVLESDLYLDSNARFAESFKILGSIYTGVNIFFKALQGIREAYEKRVQSGQVMVFNTDNPTVAASIHQKIKRLELEPNFAVL